MNDIVTHFTLGTCPFIFLVPYALIGHAYYQLSEEEKEDATISFTTLVIALPIVFGIIFAVFYNYFKFIPRKTSSSVYLRFVMCGALTAVAVSLLLHYVFHIQDEWMGYENTNMFHGAVFILYFIYFYTIGQWIRYKVLYGPAPVKKSHRSSSSSSSSSSSRSSKLEKLQKLLNDAKS